ncbi:hypothetical protein [Cupriavidus taiwanensis]|uniref:hypothetical protein n=1 Tax=Cupriavidus taiwanensis TaxID=164546 RepID=UPI000E105BF2|nr:hypothetical protein [Cupriavidus taiwanensis]SPA56707.1 protein of unknown function [Cupriavidus taiwanensis]
MAELSGHAEILIVEAATGDEETIILTIDEFGLEESATLDQDDQYYQEHGTFVAHCEAFGHKFKAIWRATAFGYWVTLNEVLIENYHPEIAVSLVLNELCFIGSPVRHDE